MKTILYSILLLTTIVSFGQTNTITFQTDASTELVIAKNGYFLDQTSPGVFAPATVTITSTLDFTGTTEPSLPQIFMPLKTPANHVYAPAGSLTEANATTTSTVGSVTTRTWVFSKIDVNTAKGGEAYTIVGNTVILKTSGGITSGGVTQVPNTPIVIVADYTAPLPSNYVEITDVATTFTTVERGAPFTISYKLTSNVAIEDLRFELWIKETATAESKQLVAGALESFDDQGTNVARTTTLTFPTDNSITKNAYTFDIVPTANLKPAESYEFRIRRNASDTNELFSNGSNAYTVTAIDFQAITDATAGVKNYELKKIAVYPNPASDIISISNDLKQEIGTVKIYDVYGKLVKKSDHFENIDISNLAKGMYLIKTDSGRLSKFIKN